MKNTISKILNYILLLQENQNIKYHQIKSSSFKKLKHHIIIKIHGTFLEKNKTTFRCPKIRDKLLSQHTEYEFLESEIKDSIILTENSKGTEITQSAKILVYNKPLKLLFRIKYKIFEFTFLALLGFLIYWVTTNIKN